MVCVVGRVLCVVCCALYAVRRVLYGARCLLSVVCVCCMLGVVSNALYDV